MSTSDDLRIGPLPQSAMTELTDLFGRAFLSPQPKDYLDTYVVPNLEADRFVTVRDGDELVAAAGAYTRDMSFPGGRATPVAAVTWVGVQPGYTGRGLLRRLMTEQLHGLRRDGRESVAVLTASEAGIYGRFGYGMAAARASVTLPAGLELRPGTPVGPVRQMSREDAWPTVQRVHAAVAAERAGVLSRNDTSWNRLHGDHEFDRGGYSPLQYAVHTDGYAAFRTRPGWQESGPNGSLQIMELLATTGEAEASLWRHLLRYSLVREISYPLADADGLLADLVVQPRAVRTLVRDHVWLRLVDLDRAIDTRGYSAPASVVVRLHDDFCPWNDGTWQFDLDAGGGRARRSNDPAQVELDTTDLAAAFLGGTRLARLVATGRVTGDRRALAALDAALQTARGPWCPEGF